MDLTAEPEEGKSAELANLIDELKHAEKRVAHAEKIASETTKAASEIMQSVSIEESLANSKVLQELKKAVDAREEARAARRKAMIERSKLFEITKKAKEQGVQSDAD